MKNHVNLVVVIPVGPKSNLAFIEDTIDSVLFFVSCQFRIIVIDDSQEGLGEKLKARFSEIDLLVNTRSNGRWGGLYVTLCRAYRYALDNSHFDALLKLDADALLIGYNPQEEAIRLFKEKPETGIAGLHLSDRKVDFYGNKLDVSWPKRQIHKICYTWKWIRNPVSNLALKKYFFKAVKQGYQIGESVFGGSYFVNETLLTKLKNEGMLPDLRLKSSILEEDHIFGILVMATGFKL